MMVNEVKERKPLHLYGTRNLSIDDRWRIAIPADLRQAMERAGEIGALYIGVDSVTKNLWLCPENQFLEMAAQNQPSLRPNVSERDYNYEFGANVERVEWDGQGRVLLGEGAARDRYPKREVTLVGAIKRLEVWGREEWLKEKERRDAPEPTVTTSRPAEPRIERDQSL